MNIIYMLKIFNSITRKKEKFKPIHARKVGLYVCGITAYDLCHIGHGRTFVAFDVVNRYLRYCGYDVNYVRNITDIEDKIILRATKNGESIEQLTDRMIDEMHRDFDMLNILRPDYEPRVTQHIDDIIDMINKLIKKQHAYVTDNGNVMFDVDSYKNYGILSRQSLDKLKIGARVEVYEKKRNPMDFVIWKKIYDQPIWPSPWGYGRPGWHIECSAISFKKLGKYFDIHGGGYDLLFPHHENEIAQSTCAHDGLYVNIWMHTGLVMVDKKKISKSLGNFFSIRDVLTYYDPETVRYFLMSCHYRSNLNYSENNLKKARAALERLYIVLRGTDIEAKPFGGENFIKKFNSAMDDDFNTPAAYSVLFNTAREVNILKLENPVAAQGLAATLRHLASVLGLLAQDPSTFLQKNKIIEKNTEIEALIQKRNEARKKNKWALADKIRNNLTEIGIVLEDGLHSTIWRRRK